VAKLALSPRTVGLSSERSASLTFDLSQKANVTVCVLNGNGIVTRTVARPGTRGGPDTIKYLVYKRLSHRLAAGHYTVLVVASNASGSGTAATPLTITLP